MVSNLGPVEYEFDDLTTGPLLHRFHNVFMLSLKVILLLLSHYIIMEIQTNQVNTYKHYKQLEEF